MVPEFKTVPMFEGRSMASAATVFGAVDTMGYDYLAIDVVAGTGDAASTAVAALQVAEGDAAITAYTSGTPITACVGAAAISTSAGFVLPALSSSAGNVYRFNIDLLGRKRYIGVYFAPEKNTVGVAALAHLFRASHDPAMVTAATTASGARLIIST